MTDNENHLKEILNVLHEENSLKDLILIGSWSLIFYNQIFKDFKPLIRTTDLDFYVPNAKSIKEKNGIINSLKDINYDVVFDSLTHKTRFISPDGFELEFLTKINRDRLSCIKIGNTGIYAEALPYVDIFTGNYIEIDYYGITVKVASPASYVIQKLLINVDREFKSQKDIESVKYVLLFINLSSKSKNELINLFDSLPKKWKKRIDDVCDYHKIKLI